MSILGRIGSAALKGISALPAVKGAKERRERTAAVWRAADWVAYQPVDDETAKAQLAERLEGGVADIQETLGELDVCGREDYISDRSYRLLAAIGAGSPVEPIPSERAGLFAREEALGRMPIEQAYATLAEIEPGLLDIERQAASYTGRQPDEQRLPKELRDALTDLVGGGAVREDTLLRGKLASSIAEHYLRALMGETRLGPTDMPFFENPVKTFSITIPLVRIGRQRPE